MHSINVGFIRSRRQIFCCYQNFTEVALINKRHLDILARLAYDAPGDLIMRNGEFAHKTFGLKKLLPPVLKAAFPF